MMENITKVEFEAVIQTMKEFDEGIWQLINREIGNGNTFSNSFIEDIGMLTVKPKFYVLKHSPEES